MIEKINKTIASAGKNRGAGIVTVLVTMTFVAILGTILLYMSYANTMIKVAEQRGVQNFYEASEVMDLIRSELQISASEAVADAQQYIIENMSTITSERDSHFKAKFVQSIGAYSVDVDDTNIIYLAGDEAAKNSLAEDIGKMLDGTGDSEVKTTFNQSFFIQSLVNAGIGDTLNDWGTIGKTNDISLDTDGDGTADDVTIIVEFTETSDNLIVTPTRVTMKGIKITFEDHRINYTSTVSSDLVINAPTFSDGSSGVYLGDVQDYAIISDGNIYTDNSANDVTIAEDTKVVAQNIYIGAMSTDDPTDVGGAGGFELENGAHLIATDQMYIGSHLTDAAKTGDKEASSIYAQDINLIGNGAITIDGDAHIADDLMLDGDYSSAIIESTANYYGLGSSTTNPEDSSAIIVNGSNTTLNIKTDDEKAGEIYLAGRSFIGPYHHIPIGTTTDEQNGAIMTGEAMSFRPNQLSYLLLPSQIKTSSILSSLAITSNPMIYNNTDLASIRTDLIAATFELVDTSKGTVLTPAQTEINTGKTQTIFYPVSSTQTAVYFFVNYTKEVEDGLGGTDTVTDEDKLNTYIDDYYSKNEDKINGYIKDFTPNLISENQDIHSSAYFFETFGASNDDIGMDVKGINNKAKIEALYNQFTNITHTLSKNTAPNNYNPKDGTPTIDFQNNPGGVDGGVIYTTPTFSQDTPYEVVIKHSMSVAEANIDGSIVDVNVKQEITHAFSTRGFWTQYYVNKPDGGNDDVVAIVVGGTGIGTTDITKDKISTLLNDFPNTKIIATAESVPKLIIDVPFKGLIITTADIEIINGATITADPVGVQQAASGAVAQGLALETFDELSDILEFVVPMGEDAGEKAEAWDYDYIVAYDNWKKS